jgi:hypothetical protein
VSTIHIVGLDHFLQNVTDLCWTEDGKKEERQRKAALADLLRKIIKEAEVELIAEEGKLDDSGLGAVLAKESGNSHIDITMPIIEREKRGVKTPDYDKDDTTRKAAYRIFEQYMFEKSQAENGKVVLIMVGRRHLKGLGRLFTAAGCDVSAYDINDCDWYLGIPKEGAEGVIGHYRED